MMLTRSEKPILRVETVQPRLQPETASPGRNRLAHATK